MPLVWVNVQGVPPHGYTCGYCNHRVGPNQGWFTQTGPNGPQARILVCSYCGGPTYFDIQGRQFPGRIFGNAVASVPQEAAQLYEEARRCMSVSSFTSAVLTCRRLLMHIAVEKRDVIARGVFTSLA